jgi:hypothetical protein
MDLHWPPRSSSGVRAWVDRHHRQGSLPVKGVHRGRVRSADKAHGVAHLAVPALPAVTSASEVVSMAQIQPSRCVSHDVSPPMDDVGLRGRDWVAALWIWG